MSLDQNLFTLNVVPDASNPAFTDLLDPSGEAHYKKERLSEPPYRMNMYGASSTPLGGYKNAERRATRRSAL